MRFALLVENAHLLNLTLVEDNSIFCESLLVYFPDTLVGFNGFLSLTVDASAYVTIETNRSLVVDFRVAFISSPFLQPGTMNAG